MCARGIAVHVDALVCVGLLNPKLAVLDADSDPTVFLSHNLTLAHRSTLPPTGGIMLPGTILEVVKQFILTRILPPLVGAGTTWLLTSAHFLSIFHFGRDETAKAITELATFGIVTAFAWLGAHFSLKGHYLPGKVGADVRR
jgi:hypothetical protein